ncbi:DUF3313 domain-containing protein [Uliginosibacterium sediminicola]|uniref:DUF3313 domain-containing protein n=1 Tax=Uliginosibacterium sediminicola TaxID=2024550 RepID=A0ABU9Z2A5_9RHOO
MNLKKNLFRFTGTLLIALLAAGCASTNPTRYSDLASAGQLQTNTGSQAARIPFRYETATKWSEYRNVIIDPVSVYRGADAQFKDISEAEKSELSRYMQEAFSKELSARFKLSRDPAPGTLRVKLSLTGAEPTTRVVAPILRFDLVGMPYNIVQSIRGKEGALTGSVMYAVEIYDAQSKQLLNAYVAKQYPNAMNVLANFSALGAAKTGLDKGATELASALQ